MDVESIVMIEFREENLILGDDRDKKKGGSPSFPREKNERGN